jgi:diaminobutyrate acetyltransferase
MYWQMSHNLDIRTFQETDFPFLREIVDSDEIDLDSHSHYTYWVAMKHWPELFLVAELNSQFAGFVFGLKTFDVIERAFLWQVGVAKCHQRKGIASAPVGRFIENCRVSQVNNIALTISEDNVASLSLFRSVAKSFGLSLKITGNTGDMNGYMKAEKFYEIDNNF